MKQLDIGCSSHKLLGWIGVDLERLPGVDVVADMHHLPFRDSSIDRIHTRHTLEHVQDPLHCISELYRICKTDGFINIIVPHYSNSAYWADITHLRPFSTRSFEYFDLDYARKAGFPIYLPNVNLKTLSVRLTYWPSRIYLAKPFYKRLPIAVLNAILSGLANLSPFFCERLWCGWIGGMYEVTFELKPQKGKI
jgi:SAM-dependent methyltransferase